jgi:hypothetical protein
MGVFLSISLAILILLGLIVLISHHKEIYVTLKNGLKRVLRYKLWFIIIPYSALQEIIRTNNKSNKKRRSKKEVK